MGMKDGSHDQALIMTMEDFGNILIRQVNDLKGFVIKSLRGKYQHLQAASPVLITAA